MKNSEIEKKIANLIQSNTPDVKDKILSSLENKEATTIIMNSEFNNEKKRSFSIKKLAATLCAFIVLVSAGLVVSANNQVTVMMDVNPSITLKVNGNEKITKVTTNNQEGALVLGSMDLVGTDIGVGVNALIGSMVKNGYLNDLENSVLISVEGNNQNKTKSVELKLSECINTGVNSEELSIVCQNIKQDKNLSKQAEGYKISSGKTNFINEIISQDPTLTFDMLSGLSINEIMAIANSRGITTTATYSGQTSTKGYIGEEMALAIGLEHANLTEDEIIIDEIELDNESGVIVYDIEFSCKNDNTEYSYDINAQTGEIVKFDIDSKPDKTNQNNNQQNKNQNSKQPNNQNAINNIKSKDEAKRVALNHVGVSESEIRDYSIELDKHKGSYYYEIEFESGLTEYEIDVDAVSLEVVKVEKELVD